MWKRAAGTKNHTQWTFTYGIIPDISIRFASAEKQQWWKVNCCFTCFKILVSTYELIIRYFGKLKCKKTKSNTAEMLKNQDLKAQMYSIQYQPERNGFCCITFKETTIPLFHSYIHAAPVCQGPKQRQQGARHYLVKAFPSQHGFSPPLNLSARLRLICLWGRAALWQLLPEVGATWLFGFLFYFIFLLPDSLFKEEGFWSSHYTAPL